MMKKMNLSLIFLFAFLLLASSCSKHHEPKLLGNFQILSLENKEKIIQDWNQNEVLFPKKEKQSEFLQLLFSLCLEEPSRAPAQSLKQVKRECGVLVAWANSPQADEASYKKLSPVLRKVFADTSVRLWIKKNTSELDEVHFNFLRSKGFSIYNKCLEKSKGSEGLGFLSSCHSDLVAQLLGISILFKPPLL